MTKSVVPPEGPVPANIAIVGEAPGEEEVRVGRPFVGSSGRLLNMLLNAAGIIRHQCYVTNVSKIRPPGNDFGKQYYVGGHPTSALTKCWEELRAELACVKPRVVVALGKEALQALTGYTSIEKFRGTPITVGDFTVIPTYHPAYVLRQYDVKPTVEADLRKAKRFADGAQNHHLSVSVLSTASEVLEFLKEPHKRLSVDIETISMMTRCLGFGVSESEAVCVPLFSPHGYSNFSPEEELAIWQAVREKFLNPSVEFIFQNAQFDVMVLAREFGVYPHQVYLDTMLGHHLLYPDLPKGLDYLASIYTNVPMYWDYNPSVDEEVWRYNGYDCAVTFEVSLRIEEELKHRGLWEFYRNHVNRAIYPLLRVQSRGIRVDEELRLKLMKPLREELERLLREIGDAVRNPHFNPLSTPQVKKLLYDKWAIPPQMDTKSRKVVVDDDALRSLLPKIRDAAKCEVIRKILEYRQTNNLRSTFFGMRVHNGRMFTSYNLAGTVTGRLSSRKTPDGFGGNLQNIPRSQVRSIFTADPGMVLVKADLSQAEYRVLIWKARIKRVIEKFTQDPSFDIHTWNASENIYRVPPSEVTKQMRQDAKNGVYAANYGVGALKVSRMYGMDLSTARFIIDRYHEAVPEIKGVYQAEIREELLRTRVVRNPLGRERVFFGRTDQDTFREAYSYYCQSTVADLILAALIEIDEAGIEVLLQVHDELVMQVPEGRLEESIGVIVSKMERPIKFEGVDQPLVIPVEVSYGPNWWDTKKWKK